MRKSRFAFVTGVQSCALPCLNALRERVGDMYLVHGGDMKGSERIAASWAEQNGIQQVRFGLDRKLGDRAGFRRNEQMLSLKPRYVIAFQGNGVTERLEIGRAHV